MNFNGKINLFVNVLPSGSKVYKTSVSNQDQKGNSINYSFDVVPAKELKDKFAGLSDEKYYVMNVEGFISARSINTQSGTRNIPVLIVMEAEMLEEKALKKSPNAEAKKVIEKSASSKKKGW